MDQISGRYLNAESHQSLRPRLFNHQKFKFTSLSMLYSVKILNLSLIYYSHTSYVCYLYNKIPIVYFMDSTYYNSSILIVVFSRELLFSKSVNPFF